MAQPCYTPPDTEQGVRYLTRHHVHFVRARDGDQHVGIPGARPLKRGWVGSMSLNASYVVVFVNPTDLLMVHVNDGNTDTFRCQVSGDSCPHLTCSAYYDSHQPYSFPWGGCARSALGQFYQSRANFERTHELCRHSSERPEDWNENYAKYPENQIQRQPHLDEITEPVTTGAVNHRIGLVADGCRKTGRGGKGDGYQEGCGVHPQHIGSGHANRRQQHRCSRIAHEFGQ